MKDKFTYGYYKNSNKLRYLVVRDTAYSDAIASNTKIYRNIDIKQTAHMQAGSDVVLKALENIDFEDEANFDVPDDATLHAYALPDDEGAFMYDAIGNLVWDVEEGVKISWTPYGKVREIVKGDTTTVRFLYDAAGNRIEKQIIRPDKTTITRYVRDASGNVMAVYKDTVMIEQSIYGSSRLGVYQGGRIAGHRTLGSRNYEFSNHLGNVLTVVSDNIYMNADSAWTKIISASDYYPFGLAMEGRSYSDTTYRYGFNGKEKDDKGEWADTHYDYGFRIYNPRIAKFLSVDPLTKKYPWYTPYQFAGNKPIIAIDLDGLEEAIVVKSKYFEERIGVALKNGDFEEAMRLAYKSLDAPAKDKFAEKMYGGRYAAQWKTSRTLPTGISIVSSTGKTMHTHEISGEVIGDPDNSFEGNFRLSYGPSFGSKFKVFGIGKTLEGTFTKELVAGKLDKNGGTGGLIKDADSPWRLKSSGQFAAVPVGISVTRDFTSEGVVKSEASFNIGPYERTYDAATRKATDKFKVFDVSINFGIGKIEADFSFNGVGYKAYQDPRQVASDVTKLENTAEMKIQAQKLKK